MEPLPEIGLSIANGIISLGKCITFKRGVIKRIIISNTPEFLSAPIATNNPTKVGRILKTISIPSFAPS